MLGPASDGGDESASSRRRPAPVSRAVATAVACWASERDRVEVALRLVMREAASEQGHRWGRSGGDGGGVSWIQRRDACEREDLCGGGGRGIGRDRQLAILAEDVAQGARA